MDEMSSIIRRGKRFLENQKGVGCNLKKVGGEVQIVIREIDHTLKPGRKIKKKIQNIIWKERTKEKEVRQS